MKKISSITNTITLKIVVGREWFRAPHVVYLVMVYFLRFLRDLVCALRRRSAFSSHSSALSSNPIR